MTRLHIHIGVSDIQSSIQFYASLFNLAPIKVKQDYAKWDLKEPALSFAISTRVAKGVDHLGLQVDNDEALQAIRQRLVEAGATLNNEENTNCCYAQSNKTWVTDPAGVSWENYHSIKDLESFESDSDQPVPPKSCCTPKGEEDARACC